MIKTDELLEIISNRIKQYLKDNKMTISELSKLCGVSRTTLNSWILKRKMPTIYSLFILADYLNVSIDYLAGRKDIE